MDNLKLPSKLTTFEDVQRALQDVEKSINQLSTSVNYQAEGEVTDKDGKTGDTRITQNKDKSYTFEIKTSEGWKTPVIGESAVKFKGKPSERSKFENKSIDELQVSDDSTGNTVAKKTIYDEKSDKFILPRPDYDSGWQTWTRTSHDGSGDTPLKLEHGLKTLPSMMIGYYAPDQATDSVTWFTAIKNDRGYAYNNGIGMYVDNTRVYFWGGDGNSLVGVPAPSDSSHCGAALFDDGSVRVLVWK